MVCPCRFTDNHDYQFVCFAVRDHLGICTDGFDGEWAAVVGQVDIFDATVDPVYGVDCKAQRLVLSKETCVVFAESKKRESDQQSHHHNRFHLCP